MPQVILLRSALVLHAAERGDGFPAPCCVPIDWGWTIPTEKVHPALHEVPESFLTSPAVHKLTV